MRRNSRKVAIVPSRAGRAVEPSLERRRDACAARPGRKSQEDVAIAQGVHAPRSPGYASPPSSASASASAAHRCE
ncbi:hypothetical protein WT08_20880 [Burkholderia sp. MSMB1552]|nr:hypothetical protein WT08_20880 [Burkholderia sp. MSMB1552]KWZ56449.1 hypothetical protein WS92_11470 [Burkholderia sp. MSMB1588]